jgi:acetylornithine/succinyldiaminopimelate/putrescine aminotransferase
MKAIDLETRSGAHTYTPLLSVVLTRGQGAALCDTAGRRRVDMTSEYSTASIVTGVRAMLARGTADTATAASVRS